MVHPFRRLTRRNLAFGTLTVVATAALAGPQALAVYAASRDAQHAASPAATAASSGAASATQRHHHGLLRGLARLTLRETVSVTGLSRSTVVADLRRGERFAAIAGSKASAVQNGVIAEVQAQLAKRVSAGKITQTQASQRLAAVRAALSRLMTADLASRLGRGGSHSATPSPSPSP